MRRSLGSGFIMRQKLESGERSGGVNAESGRVGV